MVFYESSTSLLCCVLLWSSLNTSSNAFQQQRSLSLQNIQRTSSLKSTASPNEKNNNNNNMYNVLSQKDQNQNVIFEDNLPPAAIAMMRYGKYNTQRMQKQQQQSIFEQDPLATLEAGNGAIDVTPFRNAEQKLTVFSRQQTMIDTKNQDKNKKINLRYQRDGIAREVSSTEELKVYPRNQYGEPMVDRKPLVMASSISSPQKRGQMAREVSSTEELKVYPRDQYGNPIIKKPRLVMASSSSLPGNTATGASVLGNSNYNTEKTTKNLVMATTSGNSGSGMNRSRNNIAREVSSTTELKVYPRNRHGEPILEKPNLVMAQSPGTATTASVLGNQNNVIAQESSNPNEATAEGTPLVMAQPTAKSKSKIQQHLATTPNAGMAELLDMNRSKSYSLAPTAVMAASVLSNSIIGKEGASIKQKSQKATSESHLSLSPSNAFPELQAKSKPVMAPTRTAIMTATVLRTGVKQDDVLYNAAQQSAVTVDNPFQYKQVVSTPEQNPGQARPAGPNQRKLVVNQMMKKQPSSAKAVSVDKPFHYKNAVSPAEQNLGQIPYERLNKRRLVVNPAFLDDDLSSNKQVSSPRVTVDVPFQYKIPQSLPAINENPARVKPPVVPARTKIPAVVAHAARSAGSSSTSGFSLSPGVLPGPEQADLPKPSDVIQLGYTDMGKNKPTATEYPESGNNSQETPFPYASKTASAAATTTTTPAAATSPPQSSQSLQKSISSAGGASPKAVAGPSPEDVYVQVAPGVLQVPIRPTRRVDPSKVASVPSTIEAKIFSPPRRNLVTPEGVGMAKGLSTEDAYMQLASGVHERAVSPTKRAESSTVAYDKKTSTTTSDSTGNSGSNYKQNLVAPGSGSMARALAGPSPEDAYVQISSGVLSVPIRNRNSASTYFSAASESIHDDTWTPQAFKTGSMQGPDQRPLPNPSGIITFPDTKPRTTTPPGMNAASTLGQHRRPGHPSERDGAAGIPPGKFDHKAGKTKKKLVSPSSGSMAKATEGPYTALPGEEPVYVSSGILSVPIRGDKEEEDDFYTEEGEIGGDEETSSVYPDSPDVQAGPGPY